MTTATDTGLSPLDRRTVTSTAARATSQWWSSMMPGPDCVTTLTGAATFRLGHHTRTGFVPADLSDAECHEIAVIVAKAVIGFHWSDAALASVADAEWWADLVALAATPDPPEPPKVETVFDPWRPHPGYRADPRSAD